MNVKHEMPKRHRMLLEKVLVRYPALDTIGTKERKKPEVKAKPTQQCARSDGIYDKERHYGTS